MRLTEIYFWDSIFLAVYLPVALISYFATSAGSVLGIVVIGFLFVLLLSAILFFMEGIIFDDDEKVIVQKEVDVKNSEVKNDEKEFLLEPEPKLRTNADISKLDGSNVILD